ncbi:hypothetical protein YPPY36_3326, partial [Yersinia pestis PY-36]
MTKGQLP